MSKPDEDLTADVVFARLEQLRELLRLVDHLREYRPVSDQRRDVRIPESRAPLTK